MRPADYTDVQLRIRVILIGALLGLLVTSALALRATFPAETPEEADSLRAGAPETADMIRAARVPVVSVIPDVVGP